jgi:hypothetical protein
MDSISKGQTEGKNILRIHEQSEREREVKREKRIGERNILELIE